MGQEELYLLKAFVKFILLPTIAFFAGFFVKWFLQQQKSRDELIQALAPARAEALRNLWKITTLPPEIRSLANDDPVPAAFRDKRNAEIMEWYTEAGALFLSWRATDLLFRLLDALRNKDIRSEDLEKAVSALRTGLKYDCGFLSYWDVKTKLEGPRRPPHEWSVP